MDIQIVGKLGPLEWIFNTPSHHRVHHGSNAQYIDKNYGNLLIIWDRMFGTFEAEEEPVKYGLVKNVNTYNPTKITFMGWLEIFKNIKNVKISMRFCFVFDLKQGASNENNDFNSFNVAICNIFRKNGYGLSNVGLYFKSPQNGFKSKAKEFKVEFESKNIHISPAGVKLRN